MRYPLRELAYYRDLTPEEAREVGLSRLNGQPTTLEIRSGHELEAWDRGAYMGELLCNALNAYGSSGPLADGFVTALCNDHRTLQASAIRSLLEVLRQYAARCEAGPWFDLRNEAAVKAAKLAAEAAAEQHIPFI